MTKLPREIWIAVFQYLDTIDQQAVALTCKEWYAVAWSRPCISRLAFCERKSTPTGRMLQRISGRKRAGDVKHIEMNGVMCEMEPVPWDDDPTRLHAVFPETLQAGLDGVLREAPLEHFSSCDSEALDTISSFWQWLLVRYARDTLRRLVVDSTNGRVFEDERVDFLTAGLPYLTEFVTYDMIGSGVDATIADMNGMDPLLSVLRWDRLEWVHLGRVSDDLLEVLQISQKPLWPRVRHAFLGGLAPENWRELLGGHPCLKHLETYYEEYVKLPALLDALSEIAPVEERLAGAPPRAAREPVYPALRCITVIVTWRAIVEVGENSELDSDYSDNDEADVGLRFNLQIAKRLDELVDMQAHLDEHHDIGFEFLVEFDVHHPEFPDASMPLGSFDHRLLLANRG